MITLITDALVEVGGRNASVLPWAIGAVLVWWLARRLAAKFR